MFTKTINELKQELIDHLATMDKTKMNIMDLNGYATVLKMVDEMLRPDPSEYFREAMDAMRTASIGYGTCCCMSDETEEMKAGDING